MKKIDAKKVMALVAVVGILVLICVWFLVCQKFNDKTASLQSQNRTLSARVEQLREYNEHKEEYQTSISQMQADMKTWFNEFPADVREEDVLALELDTLVNAEVFYTDITMQPKEELARVDAATVSKAEIEGLGEEDIVFSDKEAVYGMQIDYPNLKSVIAVINQSAGRKTIEEVNFTYNEDEMLLDGTVATEFYMLSGTGREYTAPVFEDYEAGLTELFAVMHETNSAEEAE